MIYNIYIYKKIYIYIYIYRLVYVYKDCIPYDILTANVAEYAGDTTIGGAGTRWRFSTYDVITPIDGKL